MTQKSYLETLIDDFEDDFEFKVDCKILDITEDICKALKDKGSSRADLSRRLEISKPAVTRMLNGNTNFTLKSLLKIAIALEKELDISFKEPRRKVDFNVKKETKTVYVKSGNSSLTTCEEAIQELNPENNKKEPIAA